MAHCESAGPIEPTRDDPDEVSVEVNDIFTLDQESALPKEQLSPFKSRRRVIWGQGRNRSDPESND